MVAQFMYLLRLLVLAPLLLWPLLPVASMSLPGQALLLHIDGPVGPATSDYVLRGLAEARNSSASLVILRMDTPGGLDTAMRDIIQGILASPVPVVSYVAPSGSRAASAGTYILYASHVAAMAPATNLGAATPVRIGGMPGTPTEPEKPADKKGPQQEEHASGDPMERKLVNDAVAYIRGLAQLHGRNADWAERAVREAASLSAEEARKQGVVDLIAANEQDLLQKLNGRSVKVAGHDQVLQTTGMTVHQIEPGWRSRLLSVITDPNILPILMTLGIFGLMYEMLNPGYVFPGVLGGICLLLALYASQVLPVNYAGAALILLGVAFIVAEAFVPSFGALGIGGVVAFVIGSIILVDADAASGFGVSLPLIISFGVANALLFISVATLAVKARNRRVVSGREEMLDGIGVVLEDFDGNGRIRIHSEDWNARSTVALRAGQQVRVTGLDGLVLDVQPVNDTTETSS